MSSDLLLSFASADGIANRLCDDLGNDPMDEAWLTIAYYCQAETMGEFTK